MQKYYFDTCIWRDFFEDRFDPNKKPLGKYATFLILRILNKKDEMLFSDLIIKELEKRFTIYEIEQMLRLLHSAGVLKRAEACRGAYEEARRLADDIKIPLSDALHVIIARDNNAILVSRDNHLLNVKCIKVIKPEEI